MSLPNKKCEGFDLILVCVLKDSKDLLLNPLCNLFNKIYIFSFEKIHELNKKCTPSQIMSYQAALLLHKTANFEIPDFEAITVLNQMTFTSRQTLFLIFRNNATKIGMNATANKFYQLTGKITLNSLSLTFVHFKKLMKIQFLKYGNT